MMFQVTATRTAPRPAAASARTESATPPAG
ncbi:Uncharacterised protein [Bordetella pertussis]|nr:Uncharacterised protein [Bordetella pertussis]